MRCGLAVLLHRPNHDGGSSIVDGAPPRLGGRSPGDRGQEPALGVVHRLERKACRFLRAHSTQLGLRQGEADTEKDPGKEDFCYADPPDSSSHGRIVPWLGACRSYETSEARAHIGSQLGSPPFRAVGGSPLPADGGGGRDDVQQAV